MEPQSTPVQPTPPIQPVQPVQPQQPAKNNNFLVIILSILLLITVSLAGLFYFQIQKLSRELSQLQVPVQPTPTPIAKNEVLGIQINTCCSCPTKVPRSLIGTDGWVIYERGKNYSKYLPEECNRVDCQPCPPLEEENQSKIDCKNPRPEVCTMECIENPPYICGSDGKSYCSVCQACSNKDVAWYEMKATTCEEGQLNESLSISDSELSMGWYYGTEDQKKSNTPEDWIFSESGRSSCWHKSDTQCGYLPD